MYTLTLYQTKVCTLDLETTSLYKINGNWQRFDYSLSTTEYKDIEKRGHMYIWGMYISGIFYSGRTYTELRELLEQYANKSETLVVYCHNLAFEFQWLRNISNHWDVFARKGRTPMKALCLDLNIEFRCSYMLTGRTLLKCSKDYCPQLLKKVGDLDYTLERHYLTPVTPVELEYLRVDCEIVVHIIEKFLEEYGSLDKIPMTKTGCLRKKLVDSLPYSTKQKIASQQPRTLEEFRVLADSFMGGYTHANALNTDVELENVYSKDIVSSYPSVMLTEEFPSRFIKCKDTTDNIRKNSKFCHIIKVKLTEVEAKTSITYISTSKCKNVVNSIEDNGRIISADSLEMTITDIDFQIIKDFYTFEYKITEKWVSVKSKLPKPFRQFIATLFRRKNEIKYLMKYLEKEGKQDTEEYKDLEFEYNVLVKPDINSLYGMCVTNTIRDEVYVESGQWLTKILTVDEAEKKVSELSDKVYKNVNLFSWGIYTTTYARQKLMTAVKEIDEDVVYCDTDSVKFLCESHTLEENEKVFENINKEVFEKLKVVRKELELEDTEILDIGTFDSEHTYTTFKTLGAKKYAYTYEDGITQCTVSGLPYKGKESIKSLEEFADGRKFTYEECQKKMIGYNDNQDSIILTDYLGNTTEITNERFGVFIMPTTFKLSITPDFMHVIDSYRHKSSTTLSLLSENSALQTKILGGL